MGNFWYCRCLLGVNPGGKFDQIFDLIGTQGVGKTTFLMKYFNSFGKKGLDSTWPRDNFDWYLQGIRSFDQKDDNLAMAGMLCVNDDEMTASKKSGVETLKQIASAPFFKVRKPYDTLPTKIERTFIMCRTSNLTQNLYTASHGQRKFVPFLVSKARHTMDCAGPNSSITPWLVDQFWAEAYAKYLQLKSDGKLVSFFSLSRAEEDQLQEMRVSLQYIDDIKINAIGFVNARLKQQRCQWPMQFETREIVKYITGEDRDNSSLAKKLQPILTNDLGFKHTLVKVGRSHRSGYVSTDETIKDLKQLNDDLAKA
ncbi:VapE domain-containing protein [Limosilactobacillus viscerum]|uniref:VapE domain-containing protein n=1 Tax=Limosilactobacillus viscerum TaxID=2993450 RepID=UPI002DD6AF50|nr:VapE domain-containing protein [Limosilactobacillus viscerum]